jgi:hypothetical protein
VEPLRLWLLLADEFQNMYSQAFQSPREKYKTPLTSSQVVGWEPKQAPVRLSAPHHCAARSCLPLLSQQQQSLPLPTQPARIVLRSFLPPHVALCCPNYASWLLARSPPPQGIDAPKCSPRQYHPRERCAEVDYATKYAETTGHKITGVWTYQRGGTNPGQYIDK